MQKNAKIRVTIKLIRGCGFSIVVNKEYYAVVSVTAGTGRYFPCLQTLRNLYLKKK